MLAVTAMTSCEHKHIRKVDDSIIIITSHANNPTKSISSWRLDSFYRIDGKHLPCLGKTYCKK